MPFITILTPTYNRAYCLSNLYESLNRQTVKDFEWVIVDDGSTDDTEQMCLAWCQQTADYNIVYHKQENSGKSSACNKGLSLAKGYMLMVVDSDDYLSDDAVEFIKEKERGIDCRENFAGIICLDAYTDGKMVGTTFSSDKEYIDIKFLERRKNGIKGDKPKAFYTSVLENYTFPYFEGEKFVPEAVIYNRLSEAGYLFRWFNKIIYYVEYLSDGYSKNVDRNLIKNWQGYTLYVKELVKSSAGIEEKFVPVVGFVYRLILRAMKKY